MRKILLSFLALAVFSLFFGQPEARAASANEPKTFKFATAFSYPSVDPAVNYYGWYVIELGLGETLYKLNRSLKPEPWLVTEAKQLDDLTWVFRIRDGVNFHSGAPLTAEAAKKSLERTLEKNTRAVADLKIASMEAEGQTLTIKTTSPHQTMLNALCEPYTILIDVEAEISDTTVMATGPYKLESFKPKSQATMIRFDEYWRGRPKLDRVVALSIADTDALAMALQAGELDAAQNVPEASFHLFRDTDQYKFSTASTSRVLMLFYNFKNQLPADQTLRRAMNMAIDKKSYCDILLNGSAVPAVGLFPSFLPYGGQAALGNGPVFNLEAAKKLLDEAGYVDGDKDGLREKNGQKLDLKLITYSTRPQLVLFAEAMQGQFRDLGLNLSLNVSESVEDSIRAGQFDLALYSYISTPLGDPQPLIGHMFKTDGNANFGHFSNAEVDRLVDRLAAEFEPGRRSDLAVEIQKTVLAEDAFCFISHLNMSLIMKKGVRGFETHPADLYLVTYDTDLEN